jgi:hypothetical protein
VLATRGTRGRCYDHNFGQFSAKKMAFFSKTNVMIKFLHKLALFWVKNANYFAMFFGEYISKIITSVPNYVVCEKIAQNGAQPIFVANFIHC